MLDFFASSQVLENSNTASGAGGIDSDLDLFTDAEVKSLEGMGVVGDPFEPGIERAITEKGDTGLEKGGLAAVAVNTDPGGGSSFGTARGMGNGDGALDMLEAIAVLDSSGPGGGVSIWSG